MARASPFEIKLSLDNHLHAPFCLEELQKQAKNHNIQKRHEKTLSVRMFWYERSPDHARIQLKKQLRTIQDVLKQYQP